MGWFGNFVRKGAHVASKVIGHVGTAVKTLGNFATGAGKFLGAVAPHGQAAAAVLGPLGGPRGLVAATAAHTILQHGPGVLTAFGGAASHVGRGLEKFGS